MVAELSITVLLGGLAFLVGMRLGRMLVRRGATADNLFKGKDWASLAFLGLYLGLLVLVPFLSQLQGLPLEWRVYGMRITWTAMQIILLGFCGLALVVSWRTARIQIVAVVLLGLLGLAAFNRAEGYFLAPIYASLENNLLPNGVFRQTSDSSCAPAALASVLRLWGINATESSVAQLAETSRLGTTMPQLVTALEKMGMTGVELSPTWEQMQQINRPGVLATWLDLKNGNKGAHAVGLLAMNNQTITIADPNRGQIFRLPKAEFDRIWRKQFVAVLRPEDLLLPTVQAADYLHQLGFLMRATNISDTELETAIRSFQTAAGIKVTGQLNPQTVLLLSGKFLGNVPTLDRPVLTFPGVELGTAAEAIGKSRWRN